MKSYILPIAFLFALFFSSSCYSQSADTNDKIKQVENNLTGPILVEGDQPFTIAGQMAHYNIKGVSVAVSVIINLNGQKATAGPMKL